MIASPDTFRAVYYGTLVAFRGCLGTARPDGRGTYTLDLDCGETLHWARGANVHPVTRAA